jgi:cytochrome c556
MIRTVLAMAAVAIGVSAVVAQTADPISARKALMKSNGQNLGALNRMVRGEDPFDAAKVAAAFTTWGENAPKIAGLFPPTSNVGGEATRALPKIWDNKADFEAKAAALAKAVADNKDKAKTLDELKVAFPNVGGACNACHDAYRRPAPPAAPAAAPAAPPAR